jgi:protein-S-isoprenylcysteine O-methyltransferase Ste14
MWKHLRAITLLPGTMTLLIPGTIFYFTGSDTFDLWNRAPAARWALMMLGVCFLAIGLGLFVATNRMFAKIGKGTLAPWDATQRLVVKGIYRHVRNPMMTAVFSLLLGEALITASLGILIWFVVFATAVSILIPLAEEPMLVKQFGAEYEEYRRHVPRWIPRTSAWTPAGVSGHKNEESS